jgi:uncharacterized protein YbjT (DUF2867 family)
LQIIRLSAIDFGSRRAVELILVTGATGFIGRAVARHLIAAGHRVRALVRPKAQRINLAGLDCELAFGDLGDPESPVAAAKGCGAVFHVAADYRLGIPNPAQMMETNIVATMTLLRAATAASVSRIVYTSSVGTLKLRSDGTPADEDSVAALEDMSGFHKRSKFLAEVEVRRLVQEQAVPAAIVMPSAGDLSTAPTALKGRRAPRMHPAKAAERVGRDHAAAAARFGERLLGRRLPRSSRPHSPRGRLAISTSTAGRAPRARL